MVRFSPLYQGVEILRSLTVGVLDWTLLVHAAYLGLMGWFGARVARRRLAPMLQP